jgi:hypothetical protein
MSNGIPNAVALVPLKTVSPDRWQSIVETYKAQDAKMYLPPGYTAAQIAGYEKQRAILADSLSRDDNGILEVILQAIQSFTFILSKPACIPIQTNHPWLPSTLPIQRKGG